MLKSVIFLILYLLLSCRFGPIEFHPELWSFEDIGDEEVLQSRSSSDEDENDPLNAEWESVCLNINLTNNDK